MNTKKEAYHEKFEAQLREWAADIDVLKAKADKATAEAKILYLEQIEELRAKQTVAQTKLQEFCASGEHAWDELKPGLEHTWNDLKTAIDNAVSKIK